MKRLTIAMTLLLAALPDARAGRFAGSEPFEFLSLDSGALQASMGGAFTAGGGDANVISYNPAGLALQEENHAVFMHHDHFQGVRQERMAIAFRNGFGISLDHLSFGEIRRTTLSNPSGSGLGNFGASAQSIAAGAGRPLSDRLSVGWAVKYIRETIDTARGTAWAMDAGAQYLAMEDPLWRVGVAVKNIGTKTKFETKSEPLPLAIRWGSAVQLEVLGRPVGFLADLEQDPDGRFSPHAGITAIAAPSLSVRVGYNGRNDTGLGITAGFGLQWEGIAFDYAILPFGSLGMSHQLSFGFRWGPERIERVLPDAAGKFIENNP